LRGIRLLAIDLDGTLVDSAPDLAHCVDVALESVGLAPPGVERTRSWIGDGIEALLLKAFAHSGESGAATSKFDAALEQFSLCYRANLFERSALYPEVAETLDYLRGRRIRLACITNKRESFADALLIEAGIRDRFEVLLGGDSLPEKKPSPMQLLRAARDLHIGPTDAAMLGDSRHDYDAADSAGFSFIWASYGYCAETDLPTSGAVERIERFGELCDLV
jgi:phosphoglycolate phosphatase